MTSSAKPGSRVGAAVVVVVAALAVLVPAPAWAHATLIDSSPRQGELLDELPAEVTFEFNQDMSAPAYVIVTAPDGTSVTASDPQVDGPVVTQPINDGPDGPYTMAYRAVSEDGHPVTGEITFTVGDAGGTTAADPAAGPSDSPSASSSGSGETTTGATAPPAEGGSFLSRHQVAVGVGVSLFLIAGLMLVLARRSDP